MKRALVIGATGFIGLHVTDALLAEGWSVRATRRRSSPTILLRRRPVELVHAALEDRASLEAAMRDCEVVLFTAGPYPRYSIPDPDALARAVRSIEDVTKAARTAGVRRVVYTSSVAALAPGAGVATEADVGAPDPREGVYPTTKKAMERALDAARAGGVELVSLLLGGCIGPWDLRLGTNGFVAAILHRAVPFWADGLVHLIAVEDAARAHVAALTAPSPRYLVAGRSLTVRSLIEIVADRYGVDRPGPALAIEDARRLADDAEAAAAPKKLRAPIPREFLDIAALGRPISTARAERELGLRFTPLEPALDRTVDWLIRHRLVPSNTNRRIQDVL